MPATVVPKKEEAFITEEIQSLLEKGAIVLAQQHPLNFYGFRTLPKNKSAEPEHFHPPYTFQDGGDIFSHYHLGIKLDLKEAYFAVQIHPVHQKYLNFRWKGQVF